MSEFSKEKWIETGGRVYVDAENYNAMVERVRELQEHFDGCAGAEATINDWRARAEAAEARVKELEAELVDAQRVARVLAAGFYSDAGSDEELLAAIATALAYPKPEPEPKKGERDA